MLDYRAEELVPLSQIAALIPGRPHKSSVWRWATVGVRGIRLATVVIAGRRYCSREAVDRFIAATDGTSKGKAGGEETVRQPSASARSAQAFIAQELHSGKH